MNKVNGLASSYADDSALKTPKPAMPGAIGRVRPPPPPARTDITPKMTPAPAPPIQAWQAPSSEGTVRRLSSSTVPNSHSGKALPPPPPPANQPSPAAFSTQPTRHVGPAPPPPMNRAPPPPQRSDMPPPPPQRTDFSSSQPAPMAAPPPPPRTEGTDRPIQSAPLRPAPARSEAPPPPAPVRSDLPPPPPPARTLSVTRTSVGDISSPASHNRVSNGNGFDNAALPRPPQRMSISGSSSLAVKGR